MTVEDQYGRPIEVGSMITYPIGKSGQNLKMNTMFVTEVSMAKYYGEFLPTIKGMIQSWEYDDEGGKKYISKEVIFRSPNRATLIHASCVVKLYPLLWKESRKFLEKQLNRNFSKIL